MKVVNIVFGFENPLITWSDSTLLSFGPEVIDYEPIPAEDVELIVQEKK